MGPISAAADSNSSALEAYEGLADFYDELTAGYAHDDWVAAIEEELHARELGGPLVFDVACGTGSSTLPWLTRGYRVSACDLSPAMVARARERLALGPDRVFVSDVRRLRGTGDHDLVTCLDDSVNYLLSAPDLVRAFRGIASILRPGGALVFDCNSLSLYRERFVASWQHDGEGCRFAWSGAAEGEVCADGLFTAQLEATRIPAGVATHDDSTPPRARTIHRQRHHSEATLRLALEAAGFVVSARLGQVEGARLVGAADEERHPKVLYLAQRASPGDRGGRAAWSSTRR